MGSRPVIRTLRDTTWYHRSALTTELSAQYPPYGYRRIRIFRRPRPCHEPWPGAPAVADGAATGTAQAAEEARRCRRAATPASGLARHHPSARFVVNLCWLRSAAHEFHLAAKRSHFPCSSEIDGALARGAEWGIKTWHFVNGRGAWRSDYAMCSAI
jgi:hypothetical protein